jgi:hypothetical protein
MKTSHLIALIFLLGVSMDQFSVKADAVIEEIEEGSTNQIPSEEPDQQTSQKSKKAKLSPE